MPAWASPAIFLPRSLWTFYGNRIFPREPPVGCAQRRSEESSASGAACQMHCNHRLSLPTGRTRGGKSSRPHPHPYNNTSGSVLFSSAGRLTDSRGTTSGRTRGRIWPQIRDLTELSQELAPVSVSAGEGRRARIARVFQVRPEAN